MKSIKIIIAASVFALSILAVIASFSFNLYKKNTVQCTTNTVINLNGYTLRAVFTYDFNWGDGAIIMNGQLFKAEENLGNFSRKVFFTYNIEGNGYNMTSTSTLSSLSDKVNDHDLSNVFPAFYIKENNRYNIAIFNQGRHNYVIASSNFPSFYCYQ